MRVPYVAVIAIACLGAGACKKKSPPKPLGSYCYDDNCGDGATCVGQRCVVRVGAGEPCDHVRLCPEALACSIEKTCATKERAAQLEQALNARTAEAARKAQAEKEQRLLEESGVVEHGSAAPAETVIHPAAAGTRVRVATAKAEGTVFAACRADERLVGGGCRTDPSDGGPVATSYPSHFGTDDTVGARWNCAANPRTSLHAFALCAKIAP